MTKINGLYLTPTGFKCASRDRVQPAGVFLGKLPKGEARKLRKACRAQGHRLHAAAASVRN